MSSEETIFAEAVAKGSAHERAAYLDVACAGDDRLRSQIEALLHAHDRARGILDVSPQGPSATVDDAPPPALVGSTVGPYKLLEQIGGGGMGVVYMAEQLRPIRRKVALKIIKPGMDSGQVIARFEAERQALTMMDHPNIAKVLDAGTTDAGRPYFVMELVKGVPITDYCDQARLDTRQRLGLFVEVCQAVQHAHQKGVIHRDLKPGNVLVTLHDDKPVPKVIDFGIAKAAGQLLTDKTLFTNYAQMLGTPLYMSPEQAQISGIDVDTRSDVYSLGVLLYELLTGTTPFDKQRLREAAYDEMRRIIREEEPPKPSTRLSGSVTLPIAAANRHSEPGKLPGLVRGELDWIVMKAIEKDRTRRYEAVNAFAADVRRYLADEPVQACPPSAGYKFRKFARRNRTAVAVVAALLLATVGLAASVTFAYQESRNSERVRGEQKQTRQALSQAEHFRRLAQRTAAVVAFERGLGLCEQGQVTPGLLWLSRSLTLVPPDAPDLDHAIRANLAAWRVELRHRLRAIMEHDGPVYTVAFSPDGATALTGSHDSTVRLWEPRTGEARGAPMRHAEREVRSAAFSPDGKLILTGGMDKTARLWDAATREPIGKPLSHSDFVYAVAFSPEGGAMATAGQGFAKLWDTATREQTGDLPSPRQRAVFFAFRPDGKAAVSGGYGLVQRWNLVDHTATATLRKLMTRMVYCPDGVSLVGVQEDGKTFLWEPDTGKSYPLPMSHGGSVHALDYSPDRKTVWTAGGDAQVREWDALSWESRRAPIQHQSTVYAVAITPDQKTLLTGCADGRARLWDLAAPQASPSLSLRPDGYLISTAFHPDGNVVATGSAEGTVAFWHLNGGGPPSTPIQHKGAVYAVAFNPDGTRILTACGDGAARLWVPGEAAPRATLTHGDSVFGATFSRDGQRVLTGSKDGTARLWDVATGSPRGDPLRQPGWVHSVAISPDGRLLLTGCEDGTARLWDAETGQASGAPLQHQGAVRAVAFSPDGGTVMTGIWGEGTAWLWDLASRRPLGPPLLHRAHVAGVAFHPGGELVATASFDGTAQVWDAATGKPVGPRRSYGSNHELRAVAFSPDGRTILIGGFVGARVEHVSSPAAADVGAVVADVQVLTGMELDDNNLPRSLDAAIWQARRRNWAEPVGKDTAGR